MASRPQVAQELLTNVTKALGITALDQWYYVSHQAAAKVIGARALTTFGGSVASFLKHAYPHHNFNEEKLTSKNNQEKDQKFVEVIIRQLFPNTEIYTKARKAVGIINPDTGAYLEIDFWIPSLKLGIEYQDKHHYGYQWYAHDSLAEYQKRDEIKKATMASLGYTLITIGFWWDKSIESIAATIRKYRPDLLHKYTSSTVAPIPSEPPLSHMPASPAIPGVGGIMSPFIPMYNFDPTDWYGGEKHDGVRGVYNPNLNKLLSRSGNELSVLASLLKDIPNMLLEGEIVAGRGNYNKTASVSNHTQLEKVNWPMFRYVIFDIPDAAFGNYTERYSAITRGLSSSSFIFAQPAFRVLLANKAHLKMLVDAIISDAGEGVIAQQDAQYEYGRAKGLAKIKVRRDADAQVLRVNKFSCTCKLADGATVDITFCDSFDPSELKAGDIISYYHNGHSQSGLPIRGEIYKVRYDITWEMIVGEKQQNVTKRRLFTDAIGSTSLNEINTTQNKKGHWNKLLNVRAFLDEFARTSGFDPLDPENWYQIRGAALRTAGGGGLLSAYDYNLKKALSRAYPELKFESAKFRARDKNKVKNKMGHWRNESPNVRAFLDEFARTSGFDPLVAENWYPVRGASLRNAGGVGLLAAYNFNLKDALEYAYPAVKFTPGKFITHETKVKKGHWQESLNVRTFFEDFAKSSGFDPQVPENWNSVRHSALQMAGGSGILKSYNFDMQKALSIAYPEFGA